VMALYQGAFQLGGALGPILLGQLAARTGYAAVFLTASACLGLAFGVLAWRSSGPAPPPSETGPAGRSSRART